MVDRTVVGVASSATEAPGSATAGDVLADVDAASELRAEVDEPAVQPAKAAIKATPTGNQIRRERLRMAHPPAINLCPVSQPRQAMRGI